jgi:hypothetical protein
LFQPTGNDLFYPGPPGRQPFTASRTLPALALGFEQQLQLGVLRFRFYFQER